MELVFVASSTCVALELPRATSTRYGYDFRWTSKESTPKLKLTCYTTQFHQASKCGPSQVHNLNNTEKLTLAVSVIYGMRSRIYTIPTHFLEEF